MIAAKNSWIAGFDNLSHLRPWLSDALCQLATGGGFSTRQLYSDDEEQFFEATRPILLNGIENVISRGDLTDRALVVYLPVIPADRRKPAGIPYRTTQNSWRISRRGGVRVTSVTRYQAQSLPPHGRFRTLGHGGRTNAWLGKRFFHGRLPVKSTFDECSDS
jgi:hypothetical protein